MDRNARQLTALEGWFSYILILIAVAIWVAYRPPPENYLPLVVLVLAAVVLIVRFVFLRFVRTARFPANPQDATPDSN